MKPFNKKIYSAAEFIKYHSGKLSDHEMYQLEKSALEDKFISDALEGYMFSVHSEKNLLEIKNNIADNISKTVLNTGSSLQKLYRSIAIAASVTIMLFAGYFIFSKKSEDKTIVAKLESTLNNFHQEDKPLSTTTPPQKINTYQDEKKSSIKITKPKINPRDEQNISVNTEFPAQSATVLTDMKVPPLNDDNSTLGKKKELSNDDIMTPSVTDNYYAIKAEDDNVKKIKIAGLNNVVANNAPNISPAVSAVASKSEIINEDEEYPMETSPIDGWKSYNKYIRENTKKVKDSLGVSCNGNLTLSFSVDGQGKPIDIKIEHSLNEICNKAGILILSNGPRWNRANKNRLLYKMKF